MRELTRKLVERIAERITATPDWSDWLSRTDTIKAASQFYDEVAIDGAGTDDGVVDAIGLLLEEIDRLHAIVERLPITADGVRVLPGDRVWHIHGGWRTVILADMARQLREYSTREAAMRALVDRDR